MTNKNVGIWRGGSLITKERSVTGYNPETVYNDELPDSSLKSVGGSFNGGVFIVINRGLDSDELKSITIDRTGTLVTFKFNQAIVLDVNAPILIVNNSYVVLTYVSGNGTDTWVYSIGTTVHKNDNVILFAERCWKHLSDGVAVPSTSEVTEYSTPGVHTHVVPVSGTKAWYQAYGPGANGSAGHTGSLSNLAGPSGGGGGFAAGYGLFVSGSQLRVAVGELGNPSQVSSNFTVGAAFVGAQAATGTVAGAGYTGAIYYDGGGGSIGATTGGGGGGGAGPMGNGVRGKPGSATSPGVGGAGGGGYPHGGKGGGGGLYGVSGEVGITPGGGGGGGGGNGAAGGVAGIGLVRVLTGYRTVINNSIV